MRRKADAIFNVLFIIYMGTLLTFTVLRPSRGGYALFGGSVHLTLLADYIPIYRNSVPIFIYLFFGNIVWFLPFGLFLAFCRGIPFWRTVLFGFLLSLFIETMQFVLGTGISEPDDLLLNTVGCALGAAVARLLKRLP